MDGSTHNPKDVGKIGKLRRLTVWFLLLCILSFVCNNISWFVYTPSTNDTPISKSPNRKRLFSDESHIPVSDEDMKEFVQNTLDKVINEEKVAEIRNKLRRNAMTSDVLFQPYNPSMKASQKMKLFNTCAVVGSSGILTNSHCGKEISAHNFIMRLNMAETEGFEQDVGYRTDLMSLNTLICVQLNKCLRMKQTNASCYGKYYHHFTELINSIVVLPLVPAVQGYKQKQVFSFIAALSADNLSVDLRVPANETTTVVKR